MSDVISFKPMKVGAAAVVTRPRPRKFPVGPRLAASVARPVIALPLIIVSVALLFWSGATYMTARTLVVKARPRTTPNTNVAVIVEAVAELESQARAAAEQLIHERGTITRAVSRLEQQAHALGFQVDASLKPAITNAAGFKELRIYPAVITLEPENDRDPSAFGRMLAWLRESSQIGAKVEIAALILRSKGERLGSAQVELNFWTIDQHDQPAAK